MSSILVIPEAGDVATTEPPSYIVSVDVGTTSIRCHIYNRQAVVIGEAAEPLDLSYPEPCAVELDPEQLWSKFVSVVKRALYGESMNSHRNHSPSLLLSYSLLLSFCTSPC